MYQELVLMSHLDVMLSMDSSNMHMASLTATPVVSVWGATHHYGGFMGWHQPPENAIQVDLDCRPFSIYGKRHCRRGDLACMNMIKPERIIERIEQIINPQTTTSL
jgi:ADP-heptose:LPS heptosyltransferase